MSVYVTSPRSKLEIISKAHDLRKRVNLGNKLFFPIVQFAEIVLSVIDADYSFEICSANEMVDKYAQYDPINNIMTLREDVYRGAIAGNGRHRFTVAHEVAHYVLHSSDIVLARSDLDLKIYQNPEWQANVFASELLMPSNLIKDMTADEVAIQCQTSLQAAQIAVSNARNKPKPLLQ